MNRLMSLLFLVSIFVNTYAFAIYDDQSVKNEVQASGFMVGNDSDLGGSFFYIVDKTSGICLAAMYGTPGNGGAGGLAEVSCDKLRKIPKINAYLGPIEEKKEVPVAPATITPPPVATTAPEAPITQDATPETPQAN